MAQLKRTEFEVSGLHCASCKILLETEIDALAGVKSIDVDYQTGECSVEFDESQVSFSEIKNKIESFDYKVVDAVAPKDESPTPAAKVPNAINFLLGLSIPFAALIFFGGYFLVKNFGGFEILAWLNESNLSYWLIFIIGFLVSFHCVGMCGGLVITYSAGWAAKENSNKLSFSLPHIQYNSGRIISYTVVGGILGGIGSFFAINPSFSGTVMIFAGVFMVLMAISLLTNFRWLQKLQPRTPKFVAKFLFSQRHTQKPKGPFIVGLLNGFMPCGPLQAMQIYALGTGSFTKGAISMAVYSLGTVPLMFGFGAFISTLSSRYIGKVMKFSGVVVGILALIMINRGLINFGWGFRSFVPIDSVSQVKSQNGSDTGEYQTVRMDLTYLGYDPNVLYIKKGIPVRWIINVKQMSGCTDEVIMADYNIRKTLQYGENIIEFTPTKTGEIRFSCWMQMVWGKFIVT